MLDNEKIQPAGPWGDSAVQPEREHDRRIDRFFATGRRVERHGRGVVVIGEHPGFAAAQPAAYFEQAGHHCLAESLPVVGWRDAHLVDEQLRGLVGMDIVHSTGKSDDHAVFDRDDDMVAGVAQELVGQPRFHGVVEHPGRDMVEDRSVILVQNPDLNGHGIFYSMPNYWILKTEPSTYSFDHLVKEKRGVWDGVANPVALKNMRAMASGDPVAIYHTGDEKAIIGLARVVRSAYPDPKLNNDKMVVVDLEAGKRLPKPVTLAAIKADPAFADLALVRQGRLSVVPVPAALWARLLAMAG